MEEVKNNKKKTIIISLSIVVALIISLLVLLMVIIPNKKEKEILAKIIAIDKAEIGDYIKFGKYEQDNITENGKEDIEWLVLDKKGNKLLVISKYALFESKFNKNYDKCNWDDCSLSEYLDNNFRWDSFTDYEKNVISIETIPADRNPDYSSIIQGEDVESYIFVLSVKEVNKYLSDHDIRTGIATDYAISHGVSANKDGECCWWLRTMGDSYKNASYVGYDGSVFTYGDKVDEFSYAVRPAMWIDVGMYTKLEIDYINANELIKSEKFEEALNIFKALKDYKDSKSKVELCETVIKDIKYNEALKFMQNNSYKEAVELFGTIRGYKDTEELRLTCKEMYSATEYVKAVELMEAGDYDEAYNVLSYILDYKDSRDKINECEKHKVKQAILASKEGNYITFGTFEQDYFTSNKEPIKWRILEIKEGKVLVICEKAIHYIENACYGIPYSWDKSEMRKWLNGEFYKNAFTSDEKKLIETVNVPVDKAYYDKQGSETLDSVFLLSRSEVEKYFSSMDDAECAMSAQTMHLDGWPDGDLDYWVTADWTLRSISSNGKFEMVYCNNPTNKGFGDQGEYYTGAIIRPALWIDLS